MDKSIKIIATNRRASHDYSFFQAIEAGLQLKGTEVKSLRAGKASLSDSFARLENGEIILYNMHIAPYEFGNIANVESVRPRKLLLHKSEIIRLSKELVNKGFSLIPLKLYFKHGIAKVELGLAKGKKAYDKRESIRRRESDRELRRALKVRK